MYCIKFIQYFIWALFHLLLLHMHYKLETAVEKENCEVLRILPQNNQEMIMSLTSMQDESVPFQ